MKLTTILAAACATTVLAKPGKVNPRATLTIEVAPGVTRQITEDERYELSAVGGLPHSLFVADRSGRRLRKPLL
jgi:leucyl aminopeptidase